MARRDPNLQATINQHFLNAITRGKTNEALYYLHAAESHALNQLEESALILAVEHNDERLVQVFLSDPNIDLNARGGCFQETALMRAVRKEHVHLIQLLLKAKADFHSLQNKLGDTAFSLAIRSEKTHIIAPFTTHILNLD